MSTPYSAYIGGIEYRLHDTVGLGEAERGTVSPSDAVTDLLSLISRLDGVSLLVYCVRGPRVKHDTVKNYAMVYEYCEREVPIVIVVTGLENEYPMEGWWAENEASYTNSGMFFGGHACVTATRGKRNRFGKEYEESVARVRELIQKSRLGSPWRAMVTSTSTSTSSELAVAGIIGGKILAYALVALI
jgi:hypothetical protein